MIMKRKEVDLSTANVRLSPTVKPSNEAAKDFIFGNSSESIFNVQGCKINLEGVCVRSYAADPYTLSLRLGGQWYDLGSLDASDPLIEALKETRGWKEVGPSANELERLRKQKQEEQAAIEAAEAHKQSRANAIRAEREKAAEKRRRM